MAFIHWKVVDPFQLVQFDLASEIHNFDNFTFLWDPDDCHQDVFHDYDHIPFHGNLEVQQIDPLSPQQNDTNSSSCKK